MADPYFRPDEVEALIPRLAETMERIMKAHAASAEVRDRLKHEQHRIAMSGGGLLDQQAWRADTDRLEKLKREIQEGLGRIAEMGGVTKDLTLGLVDFRHLRDGREVNLCWKYGEREIRFWHGLDEGYASRKPLEGGQ